MNTDLNLSPRDRARLLNVIEEKNYDPVELILQKSQAYDQAKEVVQSYFKLTAEDANELDLITMVKGLLQTTEQASIRIEMLHKNIANLDAQLRRLVKVCDENGMDLGLSKELLRWKNQK